MKLLVCSYLLFSFTPARTPAPVRDGDLEQTADRFVQDERDELWILLAYRVVLQNWQDNQTNPRRGYNIGAVLVNAKNEPVAWGRNCNIITHDPIQHAEARLLRRYLATSKLGTLRGHTVYTTLEPCAMCAGLMIFSGVRRVVYGQTDPEYGKAVERLFLDSRKLEHGFAPYPRSLTSEASTSRIRVRLDETYGASSLAKSGDIVGWLQSDQAKGLFQEADSQLAAYTTLHDLNRSVLESALKFSKEVPDHYVPFSDQ
jgi:tRNA(Arg) A34 adenosine deaminase TadA